MAKKAAAVVEDQGGTEVAEPEVKPNDGLILLYAINPHDYYKIKSSSQQFLTLSNGKTQIVRDKEHQIVRFRNHRLWVTAEELEVMRGFPQYGNNFMEAFSQNDGHPLAVSLDGLLNSDNESDTYRGAAFLEALQKRGASIGLRPPLKAQDVRNELNRWKNGTLKPPTLKTRMTR